MSIQFTVSRKQVRYSLATNLLLFLLSSPFALSSTNNRLDTITVLSTAETQAQEGKDQVYLKNQVTEYKSKKEIDAYRGNSVGDLLSGFSGTYSGDVRNGGAIDPIIRGSWGQGRIPVLVDDTEQAITVWRGFAGVSNRNYLDPFLISSIRVEKGASLDRSLRTGPAGTVRMKTLEVDDIVKAGEKVGVELKTELATNSTSNIINRYQFGTDYRTVPDGLESGLGEWAVFFKQNDRVQARQGSRLNPKNDKAFRIAAAVKDAKFEGLLAYAYRDKGNYYAGKKGSHKYGEHVSIQELLEAESEEKREALLRSDDPYVPLIAKVYPKETEIPNTSYHSESWLAKTKFNFNSESSLKFGIRHSHIRYGDIMPSRLYATITQLGTVVQWPEANVKQTAVNLDFNYNPDNKWINLNLGAWLLRNKTKTNSAGGTPGDILYEDTVFREKVVAATYMKDITPENNPKEYYRIMRELIEEYKKDPNRTKNSFGVFNMQEAQAQYSRDNYWGLNISNRMEISPKIMLDVMANYKRETLDSTNIFEIWDKNRTNSGGDCLSTNPNACRLYSEIRSGGRQGKRNELNAGFNLTYQPTDWLLLTAGARYTHYKSIDKRLQQITQEKDRSQYLNYLSAYAFILPSKRVMEFKEPNEKLGLDVFNTYFKNNGSDINAIDPDNAYSFVLEKVAEQLNPTNPQDNDTQAEAAEIAGKIYEYIEQQGIEEFDEKFLWERGEDGKFSPNNNPLFNGTITKALLNEEITNPLTGEKIAKYKGGRPRIDTENKQYTQQQLNKLSQPRKDHAWAPSLSATVFLTENARIYARYNETKRMPSIFEDTIGYSIDTVGVLAKRKPEHTKSVEIGYVQDLLPLFSTARRADFRINYFHNVTRHIYDRVWHDFYYLELQQFDKRTLEGIELQARYDQGQFFGDLSFTYNIKNKLCDKNIAFLETPLRHKIDYLDGTTDTVKTYPTCVNGGNRDGYLKNAILPDYSIVANLGTRLFNEKLEISTRLTYHTNVKHTRNRSLREAGFLNGRTDNPRWQPVFLVDAYMNYQYNQNLNFSLAVTNLADTYYLDPMTRSSMPAPGRTIKFGVTARF
ncbi:TonB-dependent receptor domain-containing protein [Bisgaard Taxon 45]